VIAAPPFARRALITCYSARLFGAGRPEKPSYGGEGANRRSPGSG
jgi:hypothetical protein